MKNFLNMIPFNGSKTYICIVVYLLVLGAGQAGLLDLGTVDLLTKWLEPLTAGALAHKVSKL